MDTPFLERAVDLALASVTDGGGPFGAVVVRAGEIIGSGSNRVVASRDPTAHAEVLAIRAACDHLGTHDLRGCEIHSSCEPCPMCLGAILWARIARVHFAATAGDAAGAGFDDAHQHREIGLPASERELQMVHLELASARRPFDAWLSMADRVAY